MDDLANALIFLMKKYNSKETINVVTGEDISIKELSRSMQNIIGFNGEIKWNTKMPEGTPRKLLDVSKINNLGWKADIKLNTGIKLTYDWYTKNLK